MTLVGPFEMTLLMIRDNVFRKDRWLRQDDIEEENG